MTPLVSRAASGLVPPRRTQRSTATLLTAHYGGDSPWGASADRSSAERFVATTNHNRCATIWRAWQSYHMNARGWADIGYNSGVCPHGYRFEGRGPGVRSGAQLGTVNDITDGICYIAGAGDPLTDPAKHGFLDEAERYGRPVSRDHSSWQATACAGDPIRAWIRAGTPRPGGRYVNGTITVGDHGPDVLKLQQLLMFWSNAGLGGEFPFPHLHPGEQNGVHHRQSGEAARRFKAIMRRTSSSPEQLGDTPNWGPSTWIEYGKWLRLLEEIAGA